MKLLNSNSRNHGRRYTGIQENAHAKTGLLFLAVGILTALMAAKASGFFEPRMNTNEHEGQTLNGKSSFEQSSAVTSFLPAAVYFQETDIATSTSPPPSKSGRAAPTSAVLFDRYFPDEYSVIATAADRNRCDGDDFLILLALRFAENGRPGREFGVLAPRAVDTDLDTQAGWCAATIVKNRQRWRDAGASGEFLDFLAQRYCPPSVDPVGHANWRVNVGHWVTRLSANCEL